MQENKPRKPGSGGKRAGAGQPTKKEVAKNVTIRLIDADKAFLQEKYGGVSAAIKTLLPNKKPAKNK